MKIITITVIILIIVVICGIFLFNNPITGRSIESTELKDYHTFTKAICNSSNYCQDYIAVCNGNKTLEIKPITGAAVQHPTEWSDSRSETEKEINCGS